jgi:hypothetical protein
VLMAGWRQSSTRLFAGEGARATQDKAFYF